MNRAYKTLGDKLRLGLFTVGQWAAMTVIALAAITWMVYVSPFGPVLTLVTTVYGAGVPAGVVLIVSLAEFRPWIYAEAWLSHRRRDGRYLPGAGSASNGYIVTREASERTMSEPDHTTTTIDLHSLWD
jgi:hypothetical protein